MTGALDRLKQYSKFGDLSRADLYEIQQLLDEVFIEMESSPEIVGRVGELGQDGLWDGYQIRRWGKPVTYKRVS